MTGGSHVATGVATAAVAYDTYLLMSHMPEESVFFKVAEKSVEFLTTTSWPLFVYMPICLVLFLLGLLLPDIDSPYSALGRIFYIPFKHRTWTHCWIPLFLCAIGSIWYRMLFWLGMGIFTHMFWDSFSASGVMWFYPLKTKHYCKLYHTSSPSEYVVMTIAVMISIIYTVFAFQHTYHFLHVIFQW